MTQLLLNIAPEWHPSLQNFVAGRNSELLSAVAHALRNTGDVNGIYIWGEAGCGKSHLLKAVISAAQQQGLSAVYREGSIPESQQVVALDQVENLNPEQQIALFSLYNQLRETGGLLLVSGQTAPAHLNLRDDLRTRLGWGLIYQLHALNDVEKTRTLHQHAAARGFELPSEVTQYLIRHGQRDLPYLLNMLDQLDTHCLRLKKRVATIPILKELMKNKIVM